MVQRPDHIRSFRDLEVWQVARKLANEVYRVTESFPQREWYGLGAQMRRSAVSIVSNIAEGFSRHTLPDYIHFLVTARASAAELEAQAIIGSDRGFIQEAEAGLLGELLASVQRMSWRLEESLRRHSKRVTAKPYPVPQAPTPMPHA